MVWLNRASGWTTCQHVISRLCYFLLYILLDSIWFSSIQNHFRLAGVLVRGDDQQPEQERGAGDGVEHGGTAHLHRIRGRRRHRRQRGRQQDLGQGDQECHASRCVQLNLIRGNSKFITVFPIFNSLLFSLFFEQHSYLFYTFFSPPFLSLLFYCVFS